MAARVPARLTPAAGRRFGLTVGSAFLTLAAVSWWRGHAAAALAFAIFGIALALAGLVLPTRLGPIERVWMQFAHAISRVTTPIVMAAMYFLVITPAGLVRRTLARSPLVHTETTTGFWKSRAGDGRSRSMERQF
jgi:hypothetical protein